MSTPTTPDSTPMPEPDDRRSSGLTMRRWVALLVTVTVIGLVIGSFAWRPSGPHTRAAIRRTLDAQVAAWNRGDLDEFLVGYWHSPQVVFLSGGTRNEGFDAMRDRYRRRYQGDGRAMGQLAFSELEIEPLGSGTDPTDAFARGRYTLVMPDGTQPTGLFTLILRRLDDGWRIVHDHTSAAEPAPTPPPAAVSP